VHRGDDHADRTGEHELGEFDERLPPGRRRQRRPAAALQPLLFLGGADGQEPGADDGEPGAEEELMMITLQMIPALRQAMQGLMTPNQVEEVKPGQPMVPLLPTQGGVANG